MQTLFETGTNSHTVNELIIYIDNTPQLCEIRDRIYKNGIANNLTEKELAYTFEQIVRKAERTYNQEFRSHGISIKANLPEYLEVSQIFARELNAWKIDNTI